MKAGIFMAAILHIQFWPTTFFQETLVDTYNGQVIGFRVTQ